VVVREGDVEATADGLKFGEADIQQQKRLFRDAALKNVAILRLIDNTLQAKRDHAIGEEFFRDILDEHFSRDEVERQFDRSQLGALRRSVRLRLGERPALPS
jgi:hypothetical protein